MKIAFVSHFDASDIHKRSGTPYHMAHALEKNGAEIHYIGSLKSYTPSGSGFKKRLQRFLGAKIQSSRNSTYAMKHYAEQVRQKLIDCDANVILTHISNPIAYLNTDLPIILWTDALYAGMLGFLPYFSNDATVTVREANAGTAAALQRCKLAIFSSEWAARSAIELYGIEKEKIKVVPFGANLKKNNTLSDIQTFLTKRTPETLKLLFIGKEWERKGGDIVFKVAKKYHALGHAVELHFVGCYPPSNVSIPSYITCYGFISKRTPEGLEKISQLLAESHFLMVPSRAEPYGIVFCEANAFGLPCITSHVGGITTIVKDNINGMTFSSDTAIETYCAYLEKMMQYSAEYEKLALSSFHEFETRLNWDVASQQVLRLITDILV